MVSPNRNFIQLVREMTMSVDLHRKLERYAI